MSSHAPPEPPLSAIRQSLLHPGVSCRRCHTLLCRHLGSEIPTGLDATRERRGEATALLVKTVILFHTKGHPKLLLGRLLIVQQPHQDAATQEQARSFASLGGAVDRGEEGSPHPQSWAAPGPSPQVPARVSTS